MSSEEQRKHKLLQTNPQNIDGGVRYRNIGFGKPQQDDEQEEQEDLDPQIYDRRKSPIRYSLNDFRQNFNIKVQRKIEIIADRNIDDTLNKKLSMYALNRIDIFFYKMLSPAGGENYCKYLIDKLNLKSFSFLKKDYSNTCISCTMNYEDSQLLLGFFDTIINAHKRSDLDDKLHSLRLIKSFNILDVQAKQEFNLRMEQDVYYLLIPTGNPSISNLEDVTGAFELKILSQILRSEGVYLTLQGNYTDLQDFLLFFESPEYVFSTELRTRIFSDEMSPAVIHKQLKGPTIGSEDNTNLPVVFLLDSGLPIDRANVNPLIERFIVDQKTIPALEREHPTRDHAVQMAGIIIYGQQFHKISDYENFTNSIITPYSRVYSFLVGTEKPKIGIWSLPDLFEALRQDPLVDSQNIKIFNLSRNVDFHKKENENISFLSYTLDKYLFFHPEILVINSVGNYNGEKNDNFFTYPQCNINIPSDAINILSIGSFGVNENNEVYIASGTSKNNHDKGMIKNDLSGKNNIDTKNQIKRSDNYYMKPDVLGLGDGRTSTTQATMLALITEEERNGTSHATAYVSHISGKILSLYPELKYAMSVENIILKFVKAYKKSYHSIDYNKSMHDDLKNRIDELISKTTFQKEKIIEDENDKLHKRFVGGGIVDASDLFYNDKKTKTFIIEGQTSIGQLQYHRINLREHIPKEVLDNNIIKIDGYISYRGIPYLADSLGYNMLNIIAGVWFASDYDSDGKFKQENIKDANGKSKPSPIKWSANQLCKDWLWYPKQRIDGITTSTQLFKDLLIQNNGSIDLIIKSLIWRNREDDIKIIIKEYFDELAGSDSVDFLEEAYAQYKLSKNIDLALVKIPYSVILSIEVKAEVDIYDTVEVSQEVEI